MAQSIRCLLILGCGYVGEKLALACLAQGVQVIGTTRHQARALELKKLGIEAFVISSPAELSDAVLARCDAVLDSIPLSRDANGMFASQLQWLPQITAKCSKLKWAAYLSTTGVYGDADGAWVDESWPCKPTSARGTERLLAEQAWLNSGLPAEVFRLAGIYGAERNVLGRLKAGGYKAVAWNPPHYSSRIHVDDIVAALIAAMQQAKVGRLVNLADDMPLPHSEYVCALATMIGAPDPVILSEYEGNNQLSAAVLDFFRDNKRVSNRMLHEDLLPELKYADFRLGLRSAIDKLIDEQ